MLIFTPAVTAGVKRAKRTKANERKQSSKRKSEKTRTTKAK
jgi:hypothetical protein